MNKIIALALAATIAAPAVAQHKQLAQDFEDHVMRNEVAAVCESFELLPAGWTEAYENAFLAIDDAAEVFLDDDAYGDALVNGHNRANEITSSGDAELFYEACEILRGLN